MYVRMYSTYIRTYVATILQFSYLHMYSMYVNTYAAHPLLHTTYICTYLHTCMHIYTYTKLHSGSCYKLVCMFTPAFHAAWPYHLRCHSSPLCLAADWFMVFVSHVTQLALLHYTGECIFRLPDSVLCWPNEALQDCMLQLCAILFRPKLHTCSTSWFMSPVCAVWQGINPALCSPREALCSPTAHVCGCMPFVCGTLLWTTRPNFSSWATLVLPSQRATPEYSQSQVYSFMQKCLYAVIDGCIGMHVLVITARTSSL